MGFVVRVAVTAVALWISTLVVDGIEVSGRGPLADTLTLIAVAIIFGLVNAILKPLLVLFTLPFILVTMGLGVIMINALLFLLVGRLVDGFEVDGFWSALLGSLVVTVTNLLVSTVTRGGKSEQGAGGGKPRSKRDDVIDI